MYCLYTEFVLLILIDLEPIDFCRKDEVALLLIVLQQPVGGWINLVFKMNFYIKVRTNVCQITHETSLSGNL